MHAGVTPQAYRGSAGGATNTYAPEVYFTFYTETLDTNGRWLFWLAPPLGFLGLICCCCCCVCLCCGQIARSLNGRNSRMKVAPALAD